MAPRHACSRLAEVIDFTAAECFCDGLSDADVEALLDDASDLVYFLSRGTVYGLCEATVRPCRVCMCGSCFACCSVDMLPLRGPVVEVTEVKIDGEVISPDLYRVTPRNFLYRVSDDGNRPASWPSSQALYLDDTEDGTFSVTYTHGMTEPYPVWVVNATIEAACDAANFQVNGRGKLPADTVGVVYQGLSIQKRAAFIEQHIEAFPALQRLLGMLAGSAMAYGPDGISGWTFPLA